MTMTADPIRGGIRLGEVDSVNTRDATVRVKFEDLGKDGFTTWDLPVVFPNTLKNKDYALPDRGEQVVCLFFGSGIEMGVVLGAIYSNKDRPPVDCQNKRHTLFEDGTFFEYDRAAHKYTAHVNGDMELTLTGNLTIRAGGVIRVTGQQILLNE